MKLYTEEQVRKSLMKHQNAAMLLSSEQIDYLIEELTPIELPTDEEIEKQSDNIAHNYFDMHNTNHYQGLREGAEKMGKWMREQILNQNK